MSFIDALNPFLWGRRAQVALLVYWLPQTARIAYENPDISLAILIPSVAAGSVVLIGLLRLAYLGVRKKVASAAA